MASTVVRVKRRREDNPQDALLVMCKKKCLGLEEETISPSLFVFRGTVVSQEPSEVKPFMTKDYKKYKTQSSANILNKIRQEQTAHSIKSRYDIINCSRGIQCKDVDEDFHLVDLQPKTDEDNTEYKEKQNAYEYDLYTTINTDFDVFMINNVVSIEDFDYSWRSVFSDEEEPNDDDDDSNDEDNWRNDYPDEEDKSVDDVEEAMGMLDMDEELSSDEGEDRIYDDDVNMYGRSYARYKQKVLQEENGLISSAKSTAGLIHSVRESGNDDDDDSDSYYSDFYVSEADSIE